MGPCGFQIIYGTILTHMGPYYIIGSQLVPGPENRQKVQLSGLSGGKPSIQLPSAVPPPCPNWQSVVGVFGRLTVSHPDVPFTLTYPMPVCVSVLNWCQKPRLRAYPLFGTCQETADSMYLKRSHQFVRSPFGFSRFI